MSFTGQRVSAMRRISSISSALASESTSAVRAIALKPGGFRGRRHEPGRVEVALDCEAQASDVHVPPGGDHVHDDVDAAGQAGENELDAVGPSVGAAEDSGSSKANDNPRTGISAFALRAWTGGSAQGDRRLGPSTDRLSNASPGGSIGLEMATDVLVILDDRPGELARLGEAAGAGGVNIQGLAAFTGEGKGVVHVLVDDDDLPRLRRALDAAGMGIADEREVLVVDVVDRPGSLGELTRRLAAAHVNVDLAYTTFGGVRLVVATDDLRGARAALR